MRLISFLLLFSFTVMAQDLWGYCSQTITSFYDFGYGTVEYFYNNVKAIMNREQYIKDEAKKDHLEHCVYKDKYGCVYRRKYLTNYHSDTLVIYLRGHWGGYKGNVPESMRDASIREVIESYELHKTYENQLDPMLISSSSHVGYTVDEINNALKAASLPEDANIVLAAHSGGYVGLLKTLKYLDKKPYKFKVKKIIMLDNFYFSEYETRTIAAFVNKGVECNGFLTAHNQTRYNTRFKNQIPSLDCPIDIKADHYSTVNKCLKQYITQDNCDIKN